MTSEESATRKSDLPVGSVVTIYGRLAVKFDASCDVGHAWRWIADGSLVDYDDVYKATWELVSVPTGVSVGEATE